MTTAAYPERPHLKHSRPLRWTHEAIFDAENAALDHLLALLEEAESRVRRRKAEDRERLRATLEAMVLDLYCAAKEDPTRFLAYSRRKEEYGRSSDHPAATLTTVTTVVAFLESAGFVSAHLASYNSFGSGDIGTGYLSRIRATPFFVDFLEGVFGVSLAGITASSKVRGRLIRLKAPATSRGTAKALLRFTETAAIAAMRERIAAGNRLRTQCHFAFSGVKPRTLDLGDVHLHRDFNNGRWDQGGRFYGGWWQTLSKETRERILINGEETVELDFQSYQPRLCFHLVGQPLPHHVDPYAIPGVDLANYREAAKRAFGQLLNSAPGQTPKRPSSFKALFPALSDYAAFIDQAERAFTPIKDWLRSGRGLEMQFLDSEIADDILSRLTAENIPCLPVHGSFIVQRSAEVALGRAMCLAYNDRLRSLSGVSAYPSITGWSSEQAMETVQASLRPL